MRSAAPRIVLAVSVLAVLSACASTPAPTATLADNGCVATPRGVVATTRGAQLALRDAPLIARLQRASTAGADGVAVLSCTPSGGALGHCVVLYEEPGGDGLGKLALAYANRVIWPTDAAEGTAEIRFRFDSSAQAPRVCR